MESIYLKEITKATNSQVALIQQMLNQLTSHPVVFTIDKLEAIIQSQGSRLFFLCHEEQVYGMITVGSYEAPTGRKTWIEDVVIDQQFRGKGLGREMLRQIIKLLSQETETTLMLTSNPKRIAANALYKGIGFEYKETNVYKMKLKRK